MEKQINNKRREGKYLTFHLGEEQYGLGILNVKEIIGMLPITALPQAPLYVLGVINLRGKVIPVIDLRRKFAMAAIDHSERTCIIVVEATGSGATPQTVGVVVDAVSEVLHIKAENIEDAPAYGGKDDNQAILGMAKEESGVKILLNIEHALQGSEKRLMGKAA